MRISCEIGLPGQSQQNSPPPVIVNTLSIASGIANCIMLNEDESRSVSSESIYLGVSVYPSLSRAEPTPESIYRVGPNLDIHLRHDFLVDKYLCSHGE